MNATSHLPVETTRIVLVGFMGAGKTTVGALLAERLKWSFVDTDQQLENQTGSTVAEIFTRSGEAGFRLIEARAIEILVERQELVLALGGGALETESTRSLLRDSHGTLIVFLDAPAHLLLARCESQAASTPQNANGSKGSIPVRPLLKQLGSNPALLEEKLASRLPHYGIAHLTVPTADRTPAEVANSVLAALNTAAKGNSTTLAEFTPTPQRQQKAQPR
ncbi:MAG TPA: shikimate kinase [Acidisarcina sp.]